MKFTLGINAFNHDASVCLVEPSFNQVLFAAHAERYSRIKNDSLLNEDIIEDALGWGFPTEICWFEKPSLRWTRQVRSGQFPKFYSIKKMLNKFGLGELPVYTQHHHQAHAAQAFYSSGMKHAGILVIDAIGEWTTTSIYTAYRNKLERKFVSYYPNSMGLFYSAVTHALGYKPNEEEYIVMGMAAYGQAKYVKELKELYFSSFAPPNFKLKQNLHRGLKLNPQWDPYNVAASAQAIWSEYMVGTALWMKRTLGTTNLIIAGGGALNCSANGDIRQTGIFDEIYVPPNPGDAGLALGAIAAHYQKPLLMSHAYLGYNIRGRVPIDGVISLLEAGEVVAIANGRAEWGPRALGNRSLLADPRREDARDRVNAIKGREGFRPFAPAVLDEHADTVFEMDHNNMDYMQFAVRCYDPVAYPAICHIDGTSRVQTVRKDNISVLRPILEAWYAKTGCPMLLNTSLNVKGEPMVNTWADAVRFSRINNIMVF